MPLQSSPAALGVFAGHFNVLPAARVRDHAQELEALGYATLWIPESAGKEVFSHAAVVLGATRRIKVASAIANIWARDPMAMVNAGRTLAEAFEGRFILGVGIGHRASVTLRGHDFSRPLSTMRQYLEQMAEAPFRWPSTPPAVPVVVGALGQGMLTLSRTHADGAHPYLVTPTHTREARTLLGPDRLLAPEQAVVLTQDPDDARRIAREHMANYLRLENYRRSLLRQGWSEEDLADGGSDRIVDALVAWGDVDTIAERIRAHHEAGADEVVVQALGPRFGYSAWSYASLDVPELRQGQEDYPIEAYRALAPLTRAAPVAP